MAEFRAILLHGKALLRRDVDHIRALKRRLGESALPCPPAESVDHALNRGFPGYLPQSIEAHVASNTEVDAVFLFECGG